MSPSAPSPSLAWLYAAFTLGILGLLLGSIITFVPGHGIGWFAACGVALLAGLFMKSVFVRVLTLLLILICAYFAMLDHVSGIKYQESLKSRGIAGAPSHP